MKNRVICGIYKIISPSGRIYIGQSTNINYRWIGYKYPGYKSNTKSILDRSLSKYGSENHKFIIQEDCDKSLLDEREIYWIEFYKSNYKKYPLSKGLNLMEGGNKPPIRNIPHLESTKELISNKNKISHSIGKYDKIYKSIIKYDKIFKIIKIYKSISECIKDNDISIYTFQNNFTEFNKLYYKDHVYSFKNLNDFTYKIKQVKPIIIKLLKVKRIRKVKLDKKIRTKEEFSKFFSDINKGRKHKFKPWSELTHISLNNHLKELHLKRQRSILQFDLNDNFIKEWNSLQEISNVLKVPYQSITRVCSGNRNKAHGYKWKYKIIK